jgi:hypothetical protein
MEPWHRSDTYSTHSLQNVSIIHYNLLHLQHTYTTECQCYTLLIMTLTAHIAYRMSVLHITIYVTYSTHICHLQINGIHGKQSSSHKSCRKYKSENEANTDLWIYQRWGGARCLEQWWFCNLSKIKYWKYAGGWGSCFEAPSWGAGVKHLLGV